MEQKEYPVGSRFQVNGQWYEVKPCSVDIECSDCCFNSKSLRFCDCTKPDSFQDCIATFRKDNADVYFVKIDPPTDTLDANAFTRAIGSTFYDNGVKLQVCDANVCGSYLPCFSHCYYHLEKCGDKMTIHGFCGIKTRSDRKDVYFKEVKDE